MVGNIEIGVINKDLRRKIVNMVVAGKNGHIPSAFSILDILNVLYRDLLHYDAKNPKSDDRDYFILSKGHGCVAYYAILHKFGFITEENIQSFCHHDGMLGEHPDTTKIPGVEASTGSLGHGFPFAVGITLGLRIQKQNNRVVTLVGDGECQEGTVWESAAIAAFRKLGNLCVIVDYNQSGDQILGMSPFAEKWKAFGWETYEVDGHDDEMIKKTLLGLKFSPEGTPKVIVARTTKGKGVPQIEGHGPWHHRIPNPEEYKMIMEALA
jgi:transketolase